MCGTRGRTLRASRLVSRVVNATAKAQGLIWSRLVAKACSTCGKLAPRGIGRPKKFLTWLATISSAAPAVKPTTTVCETKFIRPPRRIAPSASMISPDRNDSVSASCTNSALPGSANGLSDAKTTIEIAVVGPDTKCHDEPNSAATMTGTMAAYRPYSGGMPAMVAKATPCGTRIIAPVRPAVASAFRLSRVTRSRQAMKGSSWRQCGTADRQALMR